MLLVFSKMKCRQDDGSHEKDDVSDISWNENISFSFTIVLQDVIEDKSSLTWHRVVDTQLYKISVTQFIEPICGIVPWEINIYVWFHMKDILYWGLGYA